MSMKKLDGPTLNHTGYQMHLRNPWNFAENDRQEVVRSEFVETFGVVEPVCRQNDATVGGLDGRRMHLAEEGFC